MAILMSAEAPPIRSDESTAADRGEQLVMLAILKLWSRTKHTKDQEKDRDAIFELWTDDLLDWSPALVVDALEKLGETCEWWPAWSQAVDALPSKSAPLALGYDDPWERIRATSVLEWARRITEQYRGVMTTHVRRTGAADRQKILFQALDLALGKRRDIGLPDGPVWDAVECLRRVPPNEGTWP